MMIVLLGLCLPVIVLIGIVLGRVYIRSKYPNPRALGRVLPKLCVVDAEEILRYKQELAEEWKVKPHLRRALRRNQLRINSSYFCQMASNTLLMQQVVRFEELKIDPGKSSFEYDSREVVIVSLLDESARLRSEIFEARADLVKRTFLGGSVNQNQLDILLGKYKQFEQDFIALAGMAEDTTCRNMLIERLGLTNWRIVNGDSELA